jgi:hypothetical protein
MVTSGIYHSWSFAGVLSTIRRTDPGRTISDCV